MVAYIDEAGKVQLEDKKKNKEINAKIKKALGREYTQKQINALSMADAELMAEIAPYLKDRPRAKIALDTHLFNIGVLPPNKYKIKLLNIQSAYDELTKLPDRYDSEGKLTSAITTNTAGTYDFVDDKITIGKRGYIGIDKKTREKKYDRREVIATLLHELEHRGAKIIDAVFGRARNTTEDHKGIHAADVETYTQLGLGFENPMHGASTTARKKQLKETYDALKKRPMIKKRFPSIKQYNRGGKVYTNQPRKVRVRG